MLRPEENEYAPYFQRYLNRVPEGEFAELLAQNTREAMQIFGEMPPEKQAFRYEPGKWNPKEMLQHIIDSERVFAYRALVALRGDYKAVLSSMDEELYAANMNVSEKTMAELQEEFVAVRKTTDFLFRHVTEAQSRFLAKGEIHPFSARALAFITIGHMLHHMHILKERYLN